MKLTPGSIFARDFRITAPLAEGGMGAVYAVEQLSTGKRRALKVMQPALIPDARARERFVQEARIGAQVESEHIVDVVASGIDEPTGMPWIAMELLDGQDLAAYVAQRGPMSVTDAYELIAQLCDGLGAAHKKGIVHRDLKPENIFIATTRRRGSPFTLKLLDFGIAKVAQPNHTSATGTSAMGSPLWMAPEQTEAGTRLRPATDVWAIGLLAFFVLTGKSYWRAGNLAEVGLTPIFTEVLVLPLEPPAVRATQLGLGHLIPYAFDAWFMRCVARAQEQRFTDANETLRALTPQLGFVESSALRRLVPPTSVMPQSETLPPHEYAQAVRDVPLTTVRGTALPRQQGYPAPQQASGTPQQGYPSPQQGYPSPQQGHPPKQAYPQPPYAAPQQGYATPQQGYATPHQGYAAPQQGYAAPQQGPTTYSDGTARLAPYVFGGALAVIGLVGALIALWLWFFLGTRRTALPPERDAGVLVSSDAGMADARLEDAPTFLDVPLPEGPAPRVEHAIQGPGEPVVEVPVVEVPVIEAPVQDVPDAAVALDPFPEGDATHFAGHWTGDGWRYRILFTLARDGDEVSGTVRWTLLETSDELFEARIGEFATEVVAGTYDGTGRLTLEGQSVSDESLINADGYTLQVAPNGMLTGRADAGGGRFLARRE